MKGNEMHDDVLGILSEIRPDIEFENEKALIDDSILDSLDIVAIVSEFNEAFDIDISVDDLLPENFNSVDAMIALIESMQS